MSEPFLRSRFDVIMAEQSFYRPGEADIPGGVAHPGLHNQVHDSGNDIGH
mgnify:CR=1 FL=1